MFLFFFFSLFVLSYSNLCPLLQHTEAFLIDLDGTIYNDEGLIDGAQSFYDWIIKTGKPFVFLSNSAAKGGVGVQKRLMTPPWNITSLPIPLIHMQTAAESLGYYLKENAPSGSRIFFLESTTMVGNVRDSCISTIQRTVPEEMKTWTWRTDMTEDEIKEWAQLTVLEPKKTFVVNCVDGVMSDIADPVTGKPGYTDWYYSVFSKATWLLLNGATLLSSAPDLVSPPKMEGNTLIASPGPGGVHALLVAVSFPKSDGKVFVTGKGGNRGTEATMNHAVELLKKQGFNGSWSNIAMIGDTLYADIEAGVRAGMQTIFVLSGVNMLEDMEYYPTAIPTCILPNVGYIPKLINQNSEKRKKE